MQVLPREGPDQETAAASYSGFGFGWYDEQDFYCPTSGSMISYYMDSGGGTQRHL